MRTATESTESYQSLNTDSSINAPSTLSRPSTDLVTSTSKSNHIHLGPAPIIIPSGLAKKTFEHQALQESQGRDRSFSGSATPPKQERDLLVSDATHSVLPKSESTAPKNTDKPIKLDKLTKQEKLLGQGLTEKEPAGIFKDIGDAIEKKTSRTKTFGINHYDKVKEEFSKYKAARFITTFKDINEREKAVKAAARNFLIATKKYQIVSNEKHLFNKGNRSESNVEFDLQLKDMVGHIEDAHGFKNSPDDKLKPLNQKLLSLATLETTKGKINEARRQGNVDDEIKGHLTIVRLVSNYQGPNKILKAARKNSIDYLKRMTVSQPGKFNRFFLTQFPGNDLVRIIFQGKNPRLQELVLNQAEKDDENLLSLVEINKYNKIKVKNVENAKKVERILLNANIDSEAKRLIKLNIQGLSYLSASIITFIRESNPLEYNKYLDSSTIEYNNLSHTIFSKAQEDLEDLISKNELVKLSKVEGEEAAEAAPLLFALLENWGTPQK